MSNKSPTTPQRRTFGGRLFWSKPFVLKTDDTLIGPLFFSWEVLEISHFYCHNFKWVGMLPLIDFYWSGFSNASTSFKFNSTFSLSLTWLLQNCIKGKCPEKPAAVQRQFILERFHGSVFMFMLLTATLWLIANAACGSHENCLMNCRGRNFFVH